MTGMRESEELKLRTKQFALRVMKVCRALSPRRDLRSVSDQLLRSGTSVAANYRAACRSRSLPDFVSKLSVVIEEADEAEFWLELLVDAEVMPRARLAGLMDEGQQLVRIFFGCQAHEPRAPGK